MYVASLEERQIRNNEIKLVTEALYEAKVKDDEILRVLMICNVDKEEARNAIRNKTFMLSPCRKLYQYLVLEKGLITMMRMCLFVNTRGPH